MLKHLRNILPHASVLLALSCPFANAVTYIHEFPHPRLMIMYDPGASKESFDKDRGREALRRGASGLELHVRWRDADRTVVSNHDGDVTAADPTIAEIVDRILQRKGNFPTVYNNGRQFFVVLEIKHDDNAVRENNAIDGTFSLMQRYAAFLSTAVGATDPPRPLTFVVTGDAPRFYQRLSSKGAALNRLCIVEGTDYSAGTNRIQPVDNSPPFQWRTFKQGSEHGQINPLHLGSANPPGGPFNVRIWNEMGAEDFRVALSTGADSLNENPEDLNLDDAERVIVDQRPLGSSPSLAFQNTHAVLTWRGKSSNNLYLSVGLANPLSFPRQINLTFFLSEKPQCIAPALAMAPDGGVFLVYEGTGDQKLWYISGRFTSADHFLTFAGHQHLLTIGSSRRGRFPSVAIGPKGRVIVVYEGTDDHRLWYVSGVLGPNGELGGREFELTKGSARRGFTPSIAIDSRGHVLVAYRGTDGDKIFYVSGSIGTSDEIMGGEFSLTEGAARRGSTPAVAISPQGQVAIAYEGTDAERLFYVVGRLDANGKLLGTEHRLTQGQARRGHHPTISFDERGERFVILYQGTDGEKLFFVQGSFDQGGNLVGPEQQLDMRLDKN